MRLSFLLVLCLCCLALAKAQRKSSPSLGSRTPPTGGSPSEGAVCRTARCRTGYKSVYVGGSDKSNYCYAIGNETQQCQPGYVPVFDGFCCRISPSSFEDTIGSLVPSDFYCHNIENSNVTECPADFHLCHNNYCCPKACPLTEEDASYALMTSKFSIPCTECNDDCKKGAPYIAKYLCPLLPWPLSTACKFLVKHFSEVACEKLCGKFCTGPAPTAGALAGLPYNSGDTNYCYSLGRNSSDILCERGYESSYDGICCETSPSSFENAIESLVPSEFYCHSIENSNVTECPSGFQLCHNNYCCPKTCPLTEEDASYALMTSKFSIPCTECNDDCNKGAPYVAKYLCPLLPWPLSTACNFLVKHFSKAACDKLCGKFCTTTALAVIRG